MAEPGRLRPARHREKPQQVADELRLLIVSGELSEGDSLGTESDLIARFGVSRPSMREALRILEAEGLISVRRGVLGGVIVHEPDQRITARTTALVLQARDVSLADVYSARSLLEPVAARVVAESRGRRSAARELEALVAHEAGVVQDPQAFGPANTAFHQRLVSLAGNQTLTVVAEMLNELVARAVTAVSQDGSARPESLSVRLRGIRSQKRLIALIETGQGAQAEEFWRVHMRAVERILVRHAAGTTVDLMHHR